MVREENNNYGRKTDKMHVREWLHQNAKRAVKIKFGPDKFFYLLNRKGDKLRAVPISNVDGPMIIEISQESSKRPMALIRVVNDHDLVLDFNYMSERKKFLSKLEAFLQTNKQSMETTSVPRDTMLANA